MQALARVFYSGAPTRMSKPLCYRGDIEKGDSSGIVALQMAIKALHQRLEHEATKDT